jgi:hypothetical protein
VVLSEGMLKITDQACKLETTNVFYAQAREDDLV